MFYCLAYALFSTIYFFTYLEFIVLFYIYVIPELYTQWLLLVRHQQRYKWTVSDYFREESVNRSLIDLPTLRFVPVEYLYWTNIYIYHIVILDVYIIFVIIYLLLQNKRLFLASLMDSHPHSYSTGSCSFCWSTLFSFFCLAGINYKRYFLWCAHSLFIFVDIF